MQNNSKIIVIGGSSGIGYAIAQKAVQSGANVVIASRNLSALENAAQQLGPRAKAEFLDATDEKSIVDFFDRTGPFDHLAMTIKPKLPSGRFLENEISTVMAAFDAKFWGQYRLAKAAMRYVQPNGSIVMTSGVASLRHFPGYSAVSAANAAIEALSKSLAVELAPIRVNTVCPGFVCDGGTGSSREQHVRSLLPHLPLNRLAKASEIADAYLFLFNNTYATGTIVVVDGGVTC